MPARPPGVPAPAPPTGYARRWADARRRAASSSPQRIRHGHPRILFPSSRHFRSPPRPRKGRKVAARCHGRQPAASSARRTRSMHSAGSPKKERPTIRTTRHPFAARSSRRPMSRSNCLLSVRCCSPSYSTMTRHCRYTRLPRPMNRPRASLMVTFTSGSGSPACRIARRTNVSGLDSAPGRISPIARSAFRLPRPRQSSTRSTSSRTGTHGRSDQASGITGSSTRASPTATKSGRDRWLASWQNSVTGSTIGRPRR